MGWRPAHRARGGGAPSSAADSARGRAGPASSGAPQTSPRRSKRLATSDVVLEERTQTLRESDDEAGKTRPSIGTSSSGPSSRRRRHDSGALSGGTAPGGDPGLCAAPGAPRLDATPLESILRAFTGGLRSNAHRAAPDWSLVMPAYPDPKEEMVREGLLCGAVNELHKAASVGSSVARAIPLVAVAASAGSGKSMFLQQIARLGNTGFADALLSVKTAHWAKTVVFLGVNFNSCYKVTHAEVALVEEKLLDIMHLTFLRLVFLELADLSCMEAGYVRFIREVDIKLRSGSLTKDAIKAEASHLVLTRGGRAPASAPVVLLVDEAVKLRLDLLADRLAAAHCKEAAAVRSGRTARTVRRGVVSEVLGAACDLTDAVKGVTFASTLDWETASDSATLSGRSVLAVSDLHCSDAEGLARLVAAGLISLAEAGYHVIRNERSNGVLYDRLKTDVTIGRQASAGVQLSDESRTGLLRAAKGLSYSAGGHMRSAAMLGLALSQAADYVPSDAPECSLRDVLLAADQVGTSEQAMRAWGAADPRDVDQVLSYVLLGDRVSAVEPTFAFTRERRASPTANALASSSAGGGACAAEETLDIPANFDHCRFQSVVLGSGKNFIPRVPPLVLLNLMLISSVQRCTLYSSLQALLQGGTEATADQRWEFFGCTLEWVHSLCRHVQPGVKYHAISLKHLLRADRGAYAGDGDLLCKALVDASRRRRGVLERELFHVVSLAQSADSSPSGAHDVLDYVYRLAPCTVGLDALYFFRVVGGPAALVGQLVMVGVQFKCSTVESQQVLYPEDVFSDWDKLPTDFHGHFEKWRSRFVYVNLADRRTGKFRDRLTKRAKDKVIPEHCAAQSIVLGRDHLEDCLGSSAYHFVRSMGWLSHCNVTNI